MSDTASERIYRTRTGELVDGKHPGAAFLAYAKGDALSPKDAAAWKKRAVPEDKARRAPASKTTVPKPPAKS